jgi:tetratricopeptide (TPR) repeat protein
MAAPPMKTSLGFSLLLALVIGIAAPARAQDTMTAKEHYQKGTSYYDLGRYADAITEFEAAYQIKNDPALLYNLAQSHRLAGNSERALHFYRTYLRYAPKAPNRAEIESRISQLEKVVADRNAAQTAPPVQTMPPSGMTPETTTPPPPPSSTTPPTPPTSTAPPPGLPPAANPDATVGRAAGYPPPPAPGANPNAGRTLQRVGIGVTIAGGALVVIGLAYGLRAVGAANEINDAAAKGGMFDPAVEQRGKDSVKAEAGFLVLGLAAGAVGGVLYYLGVRQAREASVQVSPMASASGAGAMVRLRF